MNPLTSDGSQVASVSTESVESATKLRYSVKTRLPACNAEHFEPQGRRYKSTQS